MGKVKQELKKERLFLKRVPRAIMMKSKVFKSEIC